MTVMFLGASFSQTSPIIYAKSKGYRIITLDNRPSNPGHRYADATYNVSTTDFSKVWDVACHEKIDVAVCYASDVACQVANEINRRLGKIANSETAIHTLTNKAAFRQLLNNSGLQLMPTWNEQDSHAQSQIPLPVIVKPVDAAGSKGVTVVRRAALLEQALTHAKLYSPSRTAIIEPFLNKSGRQICGDGYFADGKIQFVAFGDGWFHDDLDLKIPYAESFPCTQTSHFLEKTKAKIEKVLIESRFLRGNFNLDVINVDEEPFLIEIAPRSGGNYIPDVIKLACGFCLMDSAIHCFTQSHYQPSLNVDYSLTRFEKPIANYMIHSMQAGVFEGIKISHKIEPFVLKQNIFVKHGEPIEAFTDGSKAIGHLILQFSSQQEMVSTLERMRDYLEVRVLNANL